MSWIQVLMIVGSNIALFFWAMKQSKLDNFYLHMDVKLNEYRKETTKIVNALQEQVLAIHDEVKNFHNTLCKLEEKKRK